MGHVISTVRRIDETQFHRLELTKGIGNVDRITRTPNGALYILTKTGEVYTSARVGTSVAYCGECREEVGALLGLGVITRPEAQAHFHHEAATKVWRDLRHRFLHVTNILREVPLAKQVRKALEVAANKELAKACRGIDATRRGAQVCNAAREAKMKNPGDPAVPSKPDRIKKGTKLAQVKS